MKRYKQFNVAYVFENGDIALPKVNFKESKKAFTTKQRNANRDKNQFVLYTHETKKISKVSINLITASISSDNINKIKPIFK